jgi:hypothetical protein
MLSIPLTVVGVGEHGQPFEASARTITLNRHGARIQVARLLRPGQTIRVTNENNHAETDFRVVGPTSAPLDQTGEWGIEGVRLQENIWDIQFPPGGEDSDALVLLSCRECHLLSLQSLSLVEVDVLETAGLLTKPCVHCGELSAWGYPQRSFEEEVKTYQAALRAAPHQAPALTLNRRRADRKTSQYPVRIRDYYGGTEITQTENVSPEGFCFMSPRKYLVGQCVMVTCPFDGADAKPEVRGRIVRTDVGPNGVRHIYGVFETPVR